MKCTEYGGCPLKSTALKATGITDGLCGRWLKDCHLTPDLFPVIRAMVGGEWVCEKCVHVDLSCGANLAWCNLQQDMSNLYPCKAWQPEEEA